MAANDGGLSKFQARMRAIPKAVRVATVPALMKGAEEIASAMVSLAPEKSGDLKRSIAITGPNQRTPPYSQPGGSMVLDENEVAITVGNSDVRYAHLVEYGTAKANAQPFFWPAYRLMKKRATGRIKRAMTKAIRETKK